MIIGNPHSDTTLLRLLLNKHSKISVAVSYKDLKKKSITSKYAPDLPVEIETITKEWINNIMTINTSFDKLSSDLHYTILFEDLISKSEESLHDICDFLDIEYDEEMLNYYQTTENDGLEPEGFLQWKSKTKVPLQKEVFKYKQLSQNELNAFKNLTNSLLVQSKCI